MSVKGFTDEAQYRGVMKDTLDRVEKAFDSIDPDHAECLSQFGALTIQMNKTGGQKVILSAQPSVRQLWLALAAKGVAYHFDYDHAKKQWFDDKGTGIEVLSFLEKFLTESLGYSVRFKG